MNEFFELENYTPEELNKAKEGMTLEEAYAEVTSHYVTLNYEKELKRGRLNPYMASMHAFVLKLIDIRDIEPEIGYGHHLGTEAIYRNPKTLPKLRTASIIVENDLREGKLGDYAYGFIERFASVLPRTLINYMVIRAIHQNDVEFFERIARNDTNLFMDIDKRLQEVFPKLRMKAIHTGVTYASVLLNNALEEIVDNKSSDFSPVVKIFDLLNSKQRRSISLSDQLLKSFEQAQINCKSIEEYNRNKEIFFRDILKINNGVITDPANIIGGQSPYVWTLTVKLCPMEYAMDCLMDLIVRREEIINGAQSEDAPDFSELLKNIAIQILKIDIDERIKARDIRTRFPQKPVSKKQDLKVRYPRETRNLQYVNEVIRESIDSASAAESYIDMFAINPSADGYEVPNALTMLKIMEEFGNDPAIKKVLLKNCNQVNSLWEAIPYSSVPDEYTEYEKMIAAAQILTCDIDRIDEIPEDLRKKLFSSKDFIIRILFPGFGYGARHEIALNETSISYDDRGIMNSYLMTKVLRNVSQDLIDEGFFEELRELYYYYTQNRVLKDTSIDMHTINYILEAYSYPHKPIPLATLLGIVDPNQIDFSTEFTAGDEPKVKKVSKVTESALYSFEELEKAQKELNFDEALEILEDYYFANRDQISEYRAMQLKETNTEVEEQSESKLGIAGRVLGREVPTMGMGDYLKLASIYVDNAVFSDNNLSDKQIEALMEFVASNGDILAPDFINEYSLLIQSRNKKEIRPPFNPLIYGDFIRDCRKYSFNETYHMYNSFNDELAISIINDTNYDKLTRDEMANNGLIYILLAMVLNYDKERAGFHIIEYMYGNPSYIPEDKTRAYNKAVDTILRIGPDPDIYLALFKMHSTHSYPINDKLLSVMMEMVYGNIDVPEGISTADMKRRELREGLTNLIRSDDIDKKRVLTNIAPDEFLKWSKMDYDVLLKAMVILGRNNVDVISTLNSVVLNDDYARIRAANPGVSEEELNEFKNRLVSIRNRIYNPDNHEYMISLIGGEEYNLVVYPIHKQEFREYFAKLVEPMSSKEFHSLIASREVIKILAEDMSCDNRVEGMSEVDLQKMLTSIWKQKAEQEKNLNLTNGKHHNHNEQAGS